MMEMLQMQGLGSWLAMGLLAGSVARYLLPGQKRSGCVGTVIIGIVGALLGGFLATFLGFGGVSGFDIRSFVVATLGAVLLLLVMQARGTKSAESRKKD